VIVRSLALTTELGLARTRGKVIDRGDYLVVETPDDPGYFHGNVLVLPAAPQVGEVTYWTRKFARELGGNPAIKHVTLWWDGTAGDTGAVDELRAAGFETDVHQVLAATTVDAPPTSFPIRPLREEEIEATADIGWIIGDRHDEAYREFLYRRAAWHRALVARGAATFWGAFEGDKLIATLGLVPLGDVARYQDVQTLASHRKRGIAGALLAASAKHAIAGGVERVVIMAELDSAASRVYERVGFRMIEKMAWAVRAPR
jgi:GNAT superfamily N-acetyltransferase